MSSKSSTAARASLPSLIGLPCALLSLASGSCGLAVSLLLWWRQGQPPTLASQLGGQVGLFSGALGLSLAVVGLASPRRRVRAIAIMALMVNLLILAFVLDNLFNLMAW